MKRTILLWLAIGSVAMGQSYPVKVDKDGDILHDLLVHATNNPNGVVNFATGKLLVNGIPVGAGGGGTVTSVAVSGSNGIGVSGSPITTSGTISLSLGNITPTSVAAIGNVTGANLSGTNTGDQTVPVNTTGTTDQFFSAYNATLGTFTKTSLDADLISWEAITRASGFDLFTATPSSANLLSLLTTKTGTGLAVFGTGPTITDASLSIDDTGSAFSLGIVSTSTGISADRTLTIDVGNSDRTFALTGNFTASGTTSGTNTGDQDLSGLVANIFAAKGDLLAGTGSGTFARHIVSPHEGWVLFADSTQTTGLNWKAVLELSGGPDELSPSLITISDNQVTTMPLVAVGTDRITVGSSGGNITLDLPQNIGTTSLPTFDTVFAKKIISSTGNSLALYGHSSAGMRLTLSHTPVTAEFRDLSRNIAVTLDIDDLTTSRSQSYPDADGTFTLNEATQTLTNKTIIVNNDTLTEDTEERIELVNTTPATEPTPSRVSPSIHFESHGWHPLDEEDVELEMNEFLRPAPNAITHNEVTGRLSWEFSAGGGSYIERSYIDSDGNFGAAQYIAAGVGFAVTNGLDGALRAAIFPLEFYFTEPGATIHNTDTTGPLLFTSDNTSAASFRMLGTTSTSSSTLLEVLSRGTFTGKYIDLGISGGASKFSVNSSGDIVNAGNITASGAVTGSNLSGTNTGDQTTVSGNAGTATALQTARNINGVAFDGTANITVTAAGSTLSDTVTVGKGGTGVTSITAHGVMIGNGSNAVNVTGTGTAGQVLVSNGSSADPTFQGISPIVCKNSSTITVLTSGTPADVGTISIPAGITRWRIGGTSGASSLNGFLAETASGTLGSATFEVYDASGGGGNKVINSSAGPSGTPSGISGFIAVGTNGTGYVGTGSTLYVRQTANSANAGTISYFVTIQPLP